MTLGLYGWRPAFSKLAELLFFPSFCRICSALLEKPGEKVVCNSCLEKIRLCRSPFCLSCGRFFDAQGKPHLCAACIRSRPTFSYHRSFGLYQGVLKDTILLYKYKKYKVLGKLLARLVYQGLKKDDRLWWGVEAIISVPLHPARKKARGFNQSRVLARELGKIVNIDIIEGVLVKPVNVPPQTTLNALERKKNIKGAFKVRDKAKIKDKTILLVDDVFTTGATLQEGSAVLIKAGAKEVRGITVAQA